MTADEQVLQHGRLLEQLDVLKRAGDAEGGHVIGLEAQKILAVESDRPRGRRIETRHQIEQRRFSGAVRPDKREHFALIHMHGNVVYGDDAAKALRDILDFKKAHRTRSVFR